MNNTSPVLVSLFNNESGWDVSYSILDATMGISVFFIIARLVLVPALMMALVVIFLTIFSFLSAPQFHLNMMLPIYNMMISGSLALILQAISSATCWQNRDVVNGFHTNMLLSKSNEQLDFIQFLCVVCYLLTMPLIIFERCIATLKFKTYENRRPFIAILCVLSQWIGSSMIVVSLYYKIVPFSIFATLGFLGVVVLGFTFWITDKVNHRRYNHSSTVGNSYTLSERYQLAENIRTSALMRRCVFVSVVIFPFGIGSFIIMYESQYVSVKMVCRLSWEILSVAYAFAMIFSILKTNQTWRTNFLQLLYCKCRFRVASDDQLEMKGRQSAENMYIFKTSNGKQMVFDISKETDIYFKQLHTFWNVEAFRRPVSATNSTI